MFLLVIFPGSAMITNNLMIKDDFCHYGINNLSRSRPEVW